MELGYISKAIDIQKENEISNYQYNKMRRKHRKELIKLAKEDQDFDYEYLHNLVVVKLKNMYEFYSQGHAEFLAESDLNQILETLEHAINIADKIDMVPEPTRVKELYQEFYEYIGQNIMLWWY